MKKLENESVSSLRRTAVVTLPCRLGLHARTASRFVLFAQRFHSKIRIQRGRIVADGKSILGLLLLGASWKSRLSFEAVGPDAERAVQEIESFFSDRGHCADDL